LKIQVTPHIPVLIEIQKSTSVPSGRPLIIKALNFATKAFSDRPRYTGGGGLYIEHPKEVAVVLVATGVTDPEVIAAALLHDNVEDTSTTLSEIEEGFGARVAKIVGDLTDRYTQEAYAHLPIGQRKDLERERLAGVGQESRLIKIADLISNFRSFGSTPASNRAFLFSDWAKRVLDTFSGIKLGIVPSSPVTVFEWFATHLEKARLLVFRREIAFSKL
jgi:(p)ppGpp synthase/HD superfamily hydrolase